MRVLITGGGGFIGSHLAENFQQRNDKIVLLDNSFSSNGSNLREFEFTGEYVHGDIRDKGLVEKLISEVDLVIHLAAALGVATIMSNPMESISTNVLGSEIVLQAASKFNKRIIVASTSEVYGKNPKQPLSETDDRVIGTPQNIRWSYSDAKALEESMARALFLHKKLPVTTIRFFNTVGPRQNGNYGMVLPNFINSALKNEDLVVHGTGNQTRVFCHVLDAVEAVLGLSETELSIGEVYNVGGDTEISMNELASRVIALTNSKSGISHAEYKAIYPEGFEDMQRRVPDTTKIKSVIGWTAKRSLDQIIVETADYLGKNLLKTKGSR